MAAVSGFDRESVDMTAECRERLRADCGRTTKPSYACNRARHRMNHKIVLRADSVLDPRELQNRLTRRAVTKTSMNDKTVLRAIARKTA